ncbi:hypothetical protein EMPS_00523 [Entomortierella parvispora]|uniref:Uncharacterized protein n=1 Tax=Entomortierella parvispora TaxID=205924 RepID=A0A9P3H1V9_9FUNG|nr:hypothetical protein EMPS_00523 [Entomortierella parvispora]
MVSLQVAIAVRVYQIQNIAREARPIGVHSFDGEQAQVAGDSPVNKWSLKPTKEPNTFLFSLIESYPYVGVDDNLVMATKNAADNKKWKLNYVKERDAYTIELPTNARPATLWGMHNGELDSIVTLQRPRTLTNKHLWKLIPVDE